MSNTSDDAKARAEAGFNRELQRSRQDDALKAEIAAQARTVDKKTERSSFVQVVPFAKAICSTP
jgi:hypothetical protein